MIEGDRYLSAATSNPEALSAKLITTAFAHSL